MLEEAHAFETGLPPPPDPARSLYRAVLPPFCVDHPFCSSSSGLHHIVFVVALVVVVALVAVALVAVALVVVALVVVALLRTSSLSTPFGNLSMFLTLTHKLELKIRLAHLELFYFKCFAMISDSTSRLARSSSLQLRRQPQQVCHAPP